MEKKAEGLLPDLKHPQAIQKKEELPRTSVTDRPELEMKGIPILPAGTLSILQLRHPEQEPAGTGQPM